MRRALLTTSLMLVACVLAGARSVSAQDANTFILGSATVVVPPPGGFVDVLDIIPNDHGRFASNDLQGLLAIDVPSDILERLKTQPLMPLDIYTRVVISPQIRERFIKPEIFAATVAEYKKNFASLTDPSGKTMTSAKTEMSLWTSQVRGRVTGINFDAPKNLGFFNESPNLLSTMILTTLKVDDRPVPMLISTSMLRVNGRLINVSIYKRSPNDKDIDVITAFTKSWTDAIFAANK